MDTPENIPFFPGQGRKTPTGETDEEAGVFCHPVMMRIIRRGLMKPCFFGIAFEKRP